MNRVWKSLERAWSQPSRTATWSACTPTVSWGPDWYPCASRESANQVVSEADLVIRTPGGYLGLDMCNRTDVRPGDARSLRALAKVLPRRWRGGAVVYRGDDIRLVDPAHRIWAVPAHRLLT